jgi:hypothetical protein
MTSRAMSAGTVETQSGSGRQPASAVANGDGPQPTDNAETIMTDVQQAVPVAGEYRKTATIRASQWWKMGDHPAVREYDDIDGTGNTVPWVDTLEGGHVVTPGDWIATGIQGEHWPIKNDVFLSSYAPVDPAMDFGEAIDPNASHNRRSRLTEPARKADRLGEGVKLPADIAEHVLSLGRVEWGQTPAHDAEGHGQHVATSVRLTAEHFGQEGDQHMHGLWLAGTETVLCHTGTSPNAPKTTQALVGAWNWLVDQASAATSSDPTHTREAEWKPMDDAPIERFVLVSLADGSEEDVVEAMQYHKDGWKMFGCNGGRSINPVAWMEKPLPFRAALFAGSAQ